VSDERQEGTESRLTGRSWSDRNPPRAAVAYAAAYLAIAIAGGWLVHVLPTDTGQLVGVTVVSAAALLPVLLLVLSVCRIPMRPRAEALWMVAMIAAFCLFRPAVLGIIGRLLGLPAVAELGGKLSIALQQELLGNLTLILWAIFLGRLVSRVIREGKLLLPVAVVASVVDFITVLWGPVAAVSEKAPEVAQAFSASTPIAPPPGVAAPILAAIGLGDFLFLAVFLAVALRYAMNAAGTMWATWGVMLIAPAAFFVWPEADGLPGLPFISVAVLAVNWRHMKFTREERRALVFTGILVAAVALGVWAVVIR